MNKKNIPSFMTFTLLFFIIILGIMTNLNSNNFSETYDTFCNYGEIGLEYQEETLKLCSELIQDYSRKSSLYFMGGFLSFFLMLLSYRVDKLEKRKK